SLLVKMECRVYVGAVGLTRRPADRLQRERHDRVTLYLVQRDRILPPSLEMSAMRRLLQFIREMRHRLGGRIGEARRDLLDDALIEGQRGAGHLLPLFLYLLREFLDP